MLDSDPGDAGLSRGRGWGSACRGCCHSPPTPTLHGSGVTWPPTWSGSDLWHPSAPSPNPPSPPPGKASAFRGCVTGSGGPESPWAEVSGFLTLDTKSPCHEQNMGAGGRRTELVPCPPQQRCADENTQKQGQLPQGPMPSGQSITTTEPGAQARASQQPRSLSHPSPQPCRPLTHPGPSSEGPLPAQPSCTRCPCRFSARPPGRGLWALYPRGAREGPAEPRSIPSPS